MKRSAFVAVVALVVATLGVLIALAAYFKNRSSYLYDDDDFLFDDADDLDFYTSDTEDDGDGELSSEGPEFTEE